MEFTLTNCCAFVIFLFFFLTFFGSVVATLLSFELTINLLTFKTDKECRPVLDIAFIVDSSGSIGRSNWERVKRFVKSLISKLDVRSSGTRVAAISYSTNPEVVTRFISYQGTDHVNRLIDRMRYQRGFTYTDRALLLADRNLFQRSNGMRPNVPKVF